MTFFTRLRARLSRLSQNTERANPTLSDKANHIWFRNLWHSPTTAKASSQSTPSVSVASPATPPCTHAAHQRNRHSTPGGHEGIGLENLKKAWFSRRKSSLYRQSARHMLFKEEVRSPRLARCVEYVPLVIGISSEGIEMELDDLPTRAQRSDAELHLKDFWALVAELEVIHEGEHANLESDIFDSPISNYATYKVATVVSPDKCATGDEKTLPSSYYRSKHRPVAIDINKARPTSFTEHQCNLSETFRSVLPGQWPASAASLPSSTPARPQTAATVDSELIFDWWQDH